MNPHPLDALLPEICQLVDGCKADWERQGCWSEWDQSVRDRITEYNLSRIAVADDDTHLPEPKLSELRADADRWEPIETAPTPELGGWLLLYGSTSRTGARMLVARWDGTDWESADDGYGAYIKPTHWMPLPTPPAELARQEGSAT